MKISLGLGLIQALYSHFLYFKFFPIAINFSKYSRLFEEATVSIGICA